MSSLKRKERIRHVIAYARQHWHAIVLALIAALLIGGPSVFAVQAIGNQYQGVPFLYQDSEFAYLARIHDVFDGYPTLGSPVFYEYKNVPAPLPPMGEYLYVALKFITFLPINAAVVLSKFLFPFLLFIFAYAAAYLLAEGALYRRLTALFVASLVVLGISFATPGYAFDLFRAGSSSLDLSIWSRLVNPITGAILLFAFICTLALQLRGKRYAWIAAGIALGLMSGYVFSFALAIIALGIICIALFVQKRYRAARACIYAVVLGGAINAFQLPELYAALKSPESQQFSLRNGLLITHAPLIDKVLIVATLVSAAAIFLFWRRMKKLNKARDSILTVASLIAAGFIAMNEQIITGRTIWPEHFVQYTVPISYLAIALTFSFAAASIDSRLVRRVWQAVLVVGIFVCFAFGIRIFSSYKSVLADFADEQRAAPAMQWLDANTPDDCVVFAIEDTERLAAEVPALTHCDDYWSSYVFVGIPEDRIEHNYLMRLRFAGVTAAAAPAYISAHNEEYRAVLFQDWKQIFWYSNDPWLISISDRPAIFAYFDALETKLASDYDQTLKGDFLSELQEYKLDYVLWDSEKYPDWNPADFPFLKEVYNSENVHIYAVQK